MFSAALVMSMAVALALPQPASSESSADPIVSCQVVSIEDLAVPGSDPGVLQSLKVREGMLVKKDMELGRVDDREALAALAVKQLDFEVAQQEAESDVQVKYAAEEANVNGATLKKLKNANIQSKGTITAIEIMKAEFELKKAELGIEKAKETKVSAELTARAKQAELDAAKVAVARRILRAPFDGVVVKSYKNVGEWVAPGDEVVRIVRIDRLRIPVNLDATKWTPADVENRPVTVEVKLTRDRPPVKVHGKIVFVSPVVYQGQLMEVSAEIETPMDAEGRPIVRAGLDAQMTIHVSQPVVADVASPSTTRKSASKN